MRKHLCLLFVLFLLVGGAPEAVVNQEPTAIQVMLTTATTEATAVANDNFLAALFTIHR